MICSFLIFIHFHLTHDTSSPVLDNIQQGVLGGGGGGGNPPSPQSFLSTLTRHAEVNFTSTELNLFLGIRLYCTFLCITEVIWCSGNHSPLGFLVSSDLPSLSFIHSRSLNVRPVFQAFFSCFLVLFQISSPTYLSTFWTEPQKAFDPPTYPTSKRSPPPEYLNHLRATTTFEPRPLTSTYPAMHFQFPVVLRVTWWRRRWTRQQSGWCGGHRPWSSNMVRSEVTRSTTSRWTMENPLDPTSSRIYS